MTQPELTVITATYNDEAYIEEAINSILSQTFKDFEYIIVDDGSTDKTAKMISSIRDSRVRIIKNEEKMGPGSARNRALEQSQGNYIAIMDGDDISHPERFEVQMKYLRAHPNISYLGTGIRVIDKGTGKFIRDEIKPLTNNAIRWMLLYKSPIIHATSIGCREVINEAGKYDEHLLRCQDVDLMRKISKKKELANLPKTLYTYRIRSGSSSDEMLKFGKVYAQQVHSQYMNDVLDNKFDQQLLNFVWSMRYPIQDQLPGVDINGDDFILSSVAVLFSLYMKFRNELNLSTDEAKFIRQDLLHWVSKVSSKSENYSLLINHFLKTENTQNLRPTSTLLKAWIRSCLNPKNL